MQRKTTSTHRRKQTKRKRARGKKPAAAAALSWAERSFGHGYKRVFWIGGLIAVLIYAFFFYRFFVSPYSSRWKAKFGDVTLPEGYTIHGIDVSHHQGTIDWEKLAATSIGDARVEFVMIKATEGRSHLDENFNDNFYRAGEHGFIRGAYHYFRPSISGDVQARYFMKQVHLEEGDLPPVLDIEEIGKLTPRKLRAEAQEWLQLVEKRYGVRPIIYTGMKFKEKYLNTPAFDRYPFWIAHYYVKKLRFKGKWKFWQHTDVGVIDGIRGKVDMNVYNGSMYDLRRLTIGHGK